MSNPIKQRWQNETLGKCPDRARIFWAARTRILLWHVAILLFVFLISIPAFRYLLFTEVDQRVQQDLVEKVKVFKSLLEEKPIDAATVEIDDLSLVRQDKRLRTPDSKEKLAEFFDAYLTRQITEDDTYLITIVDGKFYKSSPRGRPTIFKRDSALMQQWAKQTRSIQGKQITNDPRLGDVIYVVEPVNLQGRILGMLVVAHTTGGEESESIAAGRVVIKVMASALLLALLLTWFASGRVLLALRSLSYATRAINEADLNRRIEIQGTGQIADLAQSFNDMMDRLQAAFVSQRDFINDAGHELRTPITIIQGHLELMGNDPTEQQETIAIVQDELERMTRFVKDLILLAKSEHPDFLQLETVEIESFTEELCAKAQALANRNWVLDASAAGQSLFDRQRITQAIVNLAQNATQYTQPHDTIAIGSATRKGKLHFWVRDTGEGIALTDQMRIFDRFARAPNSRRRSEGAGLGLAIVKSIAEAHGGRVTVRSQIGQGATFAIVIPLKAKEPLHDADSDCRR